MYRYNLQYFQHKTILFTAQTVLLERANHKIKNAAILVSCEIDIRIQPKIWELNNNSKPLERQDEMLIGLKSDNEVGFDTFFTGITSEIF